MSPYSAELKHKNCSLAIV